MNLSSKYHDGYFTKLLQLANTFEAYSMILKAQKSIGEAFTRLLQSLNILFMIDALITFHLLKAVISSSDSHPSKRLSMDSTLYTCQLFNPEMSVSDSHPINIPFRLLLLDMSQYLSGDASAKEMHPLKR